MTTVICPSCASVIDMEQEIPFGYCKACGDRISYADASTLKLSKELLENTERLQAIKPEVLFTIAKYTQEKYGEELMKLVAEKGYLPANLHLGITYYSANKWDECKKYLEVAAKDGSNDAEALLIVLQYRNSSSNAEHILTKLKKVCEKNFENESVSRHCKAYLNTIQKAIQDAKERASSNSTFSSTWSTWDLPPSTTEQGTEVVCGPTGSATNCGFDPVGITTDL